MVINIFGKGEIYRQISPLILARGININRAIDDYSGLDADAVLQEDGFDVLFCVGYNNLHQRLQRFFSLKNKGINLTTFIADNSIASQHCTIGDGTIINQGAIIDNFAVIGEACFINIGAVISHDTVIGDGTFIAPGACIAGFVKVGEECFIGTNATIINNITIGKHSIVAAGAVVIRDVPDNVMVAGNPAVIKKHITDGYFDEAAL
jgi:sugar O-acyltransferase (sialic acid O-acetyltransferase NeuD family)